MSKPFPNFFFFKIHHYKRNNGQFRRCNASLSFRSMYSCLIIPGKDVLEKQNQFLGYLSLFEAFWGILESGLIKDKKQYKKLIYLIVSHRLSVYQGQCNAVS